MSDRKTAKLSADSAAFIPKWIRSLYDIPLPTFTLTNHELSFQAFASESPDFCKLPDLSYLAAAFPLLAQQLPGLCLRGRSAWPSVQDGLSESPELLQSVINGTVFPLTGLQATQYAGHAIALLAAEVASSRAEIPMYDLQVSRVKLFGLLLINDAFINFE